MSDTRVNVIYVKEMRNMINRIKHFGLTNHGIIFGGLVRDEIIGSHYRQEFIDKNLDFKKYWVPNYDIDTAHRLILPNDMDIYFKNDIDRNDFINKITSFVNLFNGVIVVNNVHDKSGFNNFLYTNDSLNVKFKHVKITITFYIGRTFTFHGVKLQFNIDVITSEKIDFNIDNVVVSSLRNIDNIEPPFYNLDFLCNVFIMEKINGNVVIRLSNCTGTPIDDMVFSNKARITNDIISNIVVFKTQFTRNVDKANTEYINCYRIIKMIDRYTHSWDITNIPFRVFNKSQAQNEIDTSCSICLDDIKINDDNKNVNSEEDDYVSINCSKSNKNVLHYKCFINYLKNEQLKKYRNPETHYIECRCPLRNPFNFKDCYKSVSY